MTEPQQRPGSTEPEQALVRQRRRHLARIGEHMNGRTLATAIAASMLTGFGALTFTTWRNVQRAQDSRAALCEVANKNRAIIHDILVLFQRNVARNPDLTAEQRERSNAIYAAAFTRLDPIDCHEITTGGTP